MRKTLLFGALAFAMVLPNAAWASGKPDKQQGSLIQKVHQHRKQQSFKLKSVEKVNLGKIKNREILVKLKKSGSFSAGTFGLQNVETPEPLKNQNYRIARVPKSLDYDQMLDKLRGSELIESATPNFLQKVEAVPNDSKFNSQWYLKNIHMPEAWDLTAGSSDVVVAVLDTGVDINHPDLQGKLILNQQGQDIADGDSVPEDIVGHGTHVAGIIAADTNNKIGIAGIDGLNSHIKILPVKIADNETFSIANAISGIYYATNHGADVINMSFGSYVLENPSYDPNQDPMADAVWYANDHGVTLVAAAGNDDTYEPSFPASYYPVISVSATGQNDARVDYSNYGNWIDVAAPGGTLDDGILSTALSDGYSTEAGTSFSAPIVSAVAALLKSKHPGWGPADIEWAIEQGADQSSKSEWNQDKGYGRINAYHALTQGFPDLKADAPNSEGSAASLQVGQTRSEKMNLPFDQDWYKFSLNNEAEVSVQLSNVSSTLDLGGVLDTPTKEQVIDKGGKGKTEYYTFQGTKGTYHLNVLDYYNNWSSQPYKIQVRAIPRIHGSDRSETAAAIAEQGWSSSDTVILARGYEFADALAGTPLAKELDAPILLTQTDSLPDATKKEIKRLGASKVILLGGPNAISRTVESQLKNMGLTIDDRVYGTDRSKTAVAISNKLRKLEGHTPDKAVVVYGYKFADALTIASYAAEKGYPIFLVQTDKIPRETKAALSQYSQTIVVGGEGVVGRKVFNQLKNMGCNPHRYNGDDRFETAKAVTEQLGLPTDKVFVARADEFADALSGSVLAAKNGGSLILVSPDDITATTRKLIQEQHMKNFTMFGGPNAVNQQVAKELLEMTR